jgi:branched-chain amino acid transport system permease protein
MNDIANSWWLRIVAWALVALALPARAGAGSMRSPWGRVLKGIREDEDASARSARTSTATRCRRS